MRAWQVHKHAEPEDALRLADVPPPEPPPGMVRVRVAAAGLGLPDVFLCRGSYPLTPPLPFTPGQELVGEVTAAGEGAPVRPGERVMAVSGFFLGHGAFADEALAVGEFALPVPSGMTDAQAGGFAIAYHTAWVALHRRARLQPDETLLVLGGAGGTGAAAIEIGRALGARVLATASGAERSAFCRDCGAHVVIDRHADDIRERVLAATDGQGVDCVFDPVGGSAFDAAVASIAHEGRILTIGFASGEWGRPDVSDLTYRNYSVMGVIPSGYDRGFRLEAQERMAALFAEGTLRVPVGRVEPFEHLPQALAALAAGAVLGRAVCAR